MTNRMQAWGLPFWDIFFDGVYLGSAPGCDEWDAVEFWCYREGLYKIELEEWQALFIAFRWTPTPKAVIMSHRKRKG